VTPFQVNLEAQTKRDTDAAAAAAQQHIQRLGLALEDKTSQLDMQTVRIEALTADLERAAQDMRAKLVELTETQSALQVTRHRFWNAARADDMVPRT
jgi:hypothetical protein